MSDVQQIGVRERTRRILQSETAMVARELFRTRGYEGTTVEQIADAAGISKRTFFRYFSSKEDILIEKYDLLGDQLAQALDERPGEEPVWTSLRRVLDLAVDYLQEEGTHHQSAAMEQIVQSTPALYARYLEKLSRMQMLLVDGVRNRLANGLGQASPDPKAEAIVGAAFACLVAARSTWLQSDQTGSFGELLDESMAAFTLR